MLSVIAGNERKWESVCPEDGGREKVKVKVEFTLQPAMKAQLKSSGIDLLLP